MAAAALLIAFINISLFLLFVKSIYNALRHKKGVVFRTFCWATKLTSRVRAVVAKTTARKYGTLLVVVTLTLIYTLQQKGIIGMHLLE